MSDIEEFEQSKFCKSYVFRLLLLPLMLVVCQNVFADATSVQSIISVDSRFAINSTRVNTRRLTADYSSVIRSLWSGGRIDSIVVTGTASPDGSARWNERMAALRMNSLANWMERKFSVGSSKIVRRTNISNWRRLLTLIENSYDMPNQGGAEYALREMISQREAGKNLTDLQITRYMRMGIGRSAWRYIARNLLPRMRTAQAVIYYRHDYLSSTVLPSAKSEVIPSAKSDIIPSMKSTNNSSVKLDLVSVKSDLAFDGTHVVDLSGRPQGSPLQVDEQFKQVGEQFNQVGENVKQAGKLFNQVGEHSKGRSFADSPDGLSMPLYNIDGQILS